MTLFQSCFVSAALLGGMLMVQLNTDTKVIDSLTHTLSPDQLVLYENISKKRLFIWLKGLVLGIGLAFALTPFIVKRTPTTIFGWINSCVFTSIALLANYFFYILSKKDAHMVDYLDEDQVDEWLQVKKMMQWNYHVGMLVGGAAIFILSLNL